MRKDGHLIGNHTWDHVQLDKIPAEKARLEIEKTNNRIYEASGIYPSYVRPPFGAWIKDMELSVTMLPVFWDVDTLDWKRKKAMFLSLQTSSCSHKRFAFSCLIRYTVIQSLYRFLCSRIIHRVCCTSLYTKGVIKRMDRLFNMDNKFFTVMGRVADLIMLNVVFLICCLPIVTIGASLTALHYVTLKMTRNEESYIIRSFFKSFKQNFKQATVINLIMLAVAAILYMDLRIVGNIDGTMSQVLYIVFFAFGILYMMVFLYIYPVLAKFYNSIKNTFRNAFLMAIRHLPYTVLMAVITLLPAGVFFIKSFRIQSMAIMLLCMFGFALEAFINGHFLVKIFDNYIPADADTQDTDLQNGNSAETSSAENDHTV